MKSWKRPPELNFVVLDFEVRYYIMGTFNLELMVQSLFSTKQDKALQCQVLCERLPCLHRSRALSTGCK